MKVSRWRIVVFDGKGGSEGMWSDDDVVLLREEKGRDLHFFAGESKPKTRFFYFFLSCLSVCVYFFLTYLPSFRVERSHFFTSSNEHTPDLLSPSIPTPPTGFPLLTTDLSPVALPSSPLFPLSLESSPLSSEQGEEKGISAGERNRIRDEREKERENEQRDWGGENGRRRDGGGS